MQSANDAPDRDPKSAILEVLDESVTEYDSDSNNWQLITQIDDIPAWTGLSTKELFSTTTKRLNTIWVLDIIKDQVGAVCKLLKLSFWVQFLRLMLLIRDVDNCFFLK